MTPSDNICRRKKNNDLSPLTVFRSASLVLQHLLSGPHHPIITKYTVIPNLFQDKIILLCLIIITGKRCNRKWEENTKEKKNKFKLCACAMYSTSNKITEKRIHLQSFQTTPNVDKGESSCLLKTGSNSVCAWTQHYRI